MGRQGRSLPDDEGKWDGDGDEVRVRVERGNVKYSAWYMRDGGVMDDRGAKDGEGMNYGRMRDSRGVKYDGGMWDDVGGEE
jgi:hypothetical protein